MILTHDGGEYKDTDKVADNGKHVPVNKQTHLSVNNIQVNK